MISKLTPRFANILMISDYERGHGVMFEPSGQTESGERRILQQPGCLINTKLGSCQVTHINRANLTPSLIFLFVGYSCQHIAFLRKVTYAAAAGHFLKDI